MTIKSWKACDKCGRKTRNIRIFKGRFLCFNCYQWSTHRIISAHPISDIPLSKRVSISLYLTESQKRLLNKRLELLFPTKTKKSKYAYGGLNQYARALILADLEAKNG